MDSLSSCRLLDLPIMPPAHSFFLVLFCWPMWHHPIKQQHFYDTNLQTFTAEHLCPCPPQRITHSSARPGTAILNAFLTMRKTGRGESFAVLLWHVWCWKLTSNALSISNTLSFSKALSYLLSPSPTDLCFLSFISSLHPLPLSSFIPSCFFNLP